MTEESRRWVVIDSIKIERSLKEEIEVIETLLHPAADDNATHGTTNTLSPIDTSTPES